MNTVKVAQVTNVILNVSPICSRFFVVFMWICITTSNFAATTLPNGGALLESIGVANSIFSGESSIEANGMASVAKWVRVDLDWRLIERGPKGVYSWDVVDPLVKNLLDHGLQPLFILDYGNPRFYPIPGVPDSDNHGAPTADPTGEALTAFGNFARAAAEHFRDTPSLSGITPIYEIWNEPDGDTWKPHGANAVEYTQLVQTAANQINSLQWDIGKKPAILGPVVSNLNASGRQFVASCIEAGILNYIDGLSVHPYRHTGDRFQSSPRIPETAGSDYATLRTLMANAGKSVPIISSEWGYGSIPTVGTPVNPSEFVTPLQQAQYATRMILYNTSQEIPLSIWYSWKNSLETPQDDSTPTTWENNSGLVDHEYTRNGITKLSYTALKTLVDTLGDNIYQERLLTGGNDYVLRFYDPSTGKDNLAVWTTAGTHTLNLSQYSTGTFNILSMLGEAGTINALDGRLTIELSRSPTYILGLPHIVPEPNTRSALLLGMIMLGLASRTGSIS